MVVVTTKAPLKARFRRLRLKTTAWPYPVTVAGGEQLAPYDSENPVYRGLHDSIIKCLCFLRDRAVADELTPGSMTQWLRPDTPR